MKNSTIAAIGKKCVSTIRYLYDETKVAVRLSYL